MAARQSERRGEKNNNQHVHKSAVWAAGNVTTERAIWQHLWFPRELWIGIQSSNRSLPRAQVTSCSSRCCQATLFSRTFYEEMPWPAASSKTAAFLWKTQMEGADNGRWAIQRRRRDEGGRSAGTMEPPLRPDKRRGTAGVCAGAGGKCECV